MVKLKQLQVLETECMLDMHACCTAMLHPNVHAERQRVKHFVQGLVAIPLAEILHKKTVKNMYQLDAAKHGQLQLEVRWMSILNGA